MTLAMFLAEAAAPKPGAGMVNNFQLALLAFKSGGWIVALIGAAAMVGRLLVDEAADASWQRSLRHVLAAAIFAVIAYFVMFPWDLSSLNKAIVQGLCGAVAPELVDWITTNIRRKLGFKFKKKDPAWKSLFTRRKKPKKRRRPGGRKKAVGKPAAKKPAAAKPRSPKPRSPKPAAKKPAAKKPAAAKPRSPKPDDGQASLNL